MFRFFRASFSALLIASYILAAPYSEEPLCSKMFMTRAEMVVDSVRFNNWLTENHAGLEGNQLQGVKEHAYLLIDTVVKDRHSEGRGKFSEHELFVLRTILNWGTQLGLYGCGLVAEYINASMPAPKREMVLPAVLPEDPFSLTFGFPEYRLSSSERQWSVNFPYYFMIGSVLQFKAKNGLETELAMISTLFGEHKGHDGHSQSTIMIIASPRDGTSKFRSFWLEEIGLGEKHKTKRPAIEGCLSYVGFDKKQNMRKEVCFLVGENGSYAVAYMGLDGTHQSNRTHYLDLLKKLEY